MFVVSFTITLLFLLMIGEVNTQINKLWKESINTSFIATDETIVYLKCFSEDECIYSTKSDKVYHYISTTKEQNLINITEPNFKELSSVHKINKNNKIIYFFCPLKGIKICYSYDLKQINCFDDLSDSRAEIDSEVACFPDPTNEKFHVILKKTGIIYQIDYSENINYVKNIMKILSDYTRHINFSEEIIENESKKTNQFLMVVSTSNNKVKVKPYAINIESTSADSCEVKELFIEKLENKANYTIEITFYLHKYIGLIAYNDKGNDFYQIVYTFENKNTKTVKYDSNNLNVNIGKPYTIKNIKFMNDYSNYFYYYITAKDDKNESYIGIIDIIYNVQLYHTKINSNEIGNIFAFNSNSLSLLTDKGYKICLLAMNNGTCSKCINNKKVNVTDYIFCIKDHNQDFCRGNGQSQVKNEYVFLINDTKESNENICLINKNKSSLNDINDDYYFLSNKCPSLYTLTDSGCSYCENYFFYNTTINESKCLDKCPKGYIGKNCVRCKDAGLLEYHGNNFIDESGKKISNGECILNCPEYSEISNGTCKYCKANQMYYYQSEYSNITECSLNENDGKCITKDPFVQNNLFINEGEWTYDKCSSSYLMNNSCVDKNQCNNCYLITNDTLGICQKCDTSLYYYNASCVNESFCEEKFLKKIIKEKQKYCEKCQDKLYLYENECLDDEECSNKSLVIDEVNGICHKCENDTLFYNKSCISEENCINQHLIVNRAEGICTQCEPSLFYYNNTCVEEAKCKSEHLLIDKETKICYQCKKNQVLWMNQCVSSCSDQTVKTCIEDKCECIKCQDKEQYYFNGTCVNQSDCLNKKDVIIDEISKICYSTICAFECFNNFTCDPSTNECKCGDNYSGSLCQYYKSPDEEEKKDDNITIYNLDNEKITVDKESTFGFISNLDLFDYNITWEIYRKDNGEKIKEDGMINGKNEDVVKTAKYTFEKGKYIIQCDITDSVYGKLSSKLEINIDIFDPDLFKVNIVFDKEEKVYAMKTKVKLNVAANKGKRLLNLESSSSKEKNLLFYKYYYIDIYGDTLPLTFNYTIYEETEVIIPYTKKIILEIMDIKEQSYTKDIDLPFEVYLNLNESLSLTKDIIMNKDYTVNEKLIHVYSFLIIINDTSIINEDDFEILSKFLKDAIKEGVKSMNEGKSSFTDVEKITPTSVLSILNKLMISGKGNEINSLDKLGNIIFDSVKDIKLSSLSTQNIKCIRAFYRNIDSIIEQVNTQKTLRLLQEDDNAKEIVGKILEQGRDSIQLLNKYMSNNLVQGEGKIINGKHFHSYLTMPSRTQTTIDIPSSTSLVNTKRIRRLTSNNEEDISEYDPNSSPAKTLSKKTSCQGSLNESLFCIESTDINNIQNKLSLSTVNGAKDITISVMEMNNTLILNEMGLEPISQSSIISNVYTNAKFISQELKMRTLSEDENDDESLISKLKYVISLDFWNNKEFTSSLASNSTCVSLTQLKNPKQSMSCKTYFDYSSNKTICKCSGSGEIVPIYNYTLANLYKLTQFPPLSPDLINPFNTSFIMCSLVIMSFYSLILLIMDYRDDKKYKKPNAIDEFMQINSLKDRSIITLSWYATSYTYPFLSVLFLYNYNQPRFFRFLIQMFSSLVSIVFSSIPFYKSEFTYKNLFIDKRDIATESYDIHNLPAQINDIIASFLYSICASIIANIIVMVFELLLKYKQLLLIIWKERKRIMLDYVRLHFMIELPLISFEESKRKLFIRCKAFNLITAKYFVKEQIKYKKEVYLKWKQEEITKQNEIKARSVSPLIKKAPHKIIPQLRLNSTMEINTRKYEELVIGKQNDFHINKKMSNISMKEKKEINKLRKTFYDSFETNENKTDIISNRHSSSISLHKSLPIIKEYNIETLPSYSFFNYSENKVIEEDNKKEKYQMLIMIISVILLVAFFIVVYYYIFIIFADIYQRYELYIVKSWLVPSLINIIIIRLFTTFIKNIAFMIIIKLFYSKRKKNCLFKLIFRFVIPKYLVLIYKTRNIVTKYYKEFRNELMKIKGEEFVVYL